MANDFYKLKRAPASSKKKWQVRVPTPSGRGKTVRFGQKGYEDFTQHRDTKRRENYRSRHRRDHINDPYKAGYWSWHVLWGDTYKINDAFKKAVRKAKKLVAQKNPVPERHRFPIRKKTDARRVGIRPPHSFSERGRQVTAGFSGKLPEWVGCVVNPKTMRPYFVIRNPRDSEGGIIYVPTTNILEVEAVGSFSFDTEYAGDGEYAYPASVTGMPRIHTTGGVADRGMGLGTVLYTAGALMGSYLYEAYQRLHEPELRDNVRDWTLPYLEHGGCSSGYGTSSSAEEWWTNAVAYGLAYREEGEGELVDDSVQVEVVQPFDFDGEILEEPRTPGNVAWDYANDYEAIEEANTNALMEGLEEIENVELMNVEPEGVINIEVNATFEVTLDDGAEEEITQDVSLELYADDASYDEVNDAIGEYFENTLSPERGWEDAVDTDYRINSITGRSTLDFRAEYNVTGYRRDESRVAYGYPVENAFKKRLVLDAAYVITEEHGDDIFKSRMLDVVLNLDLSEIEDPVVIKHFFALASELGATHRELQSFKNSVLAYRGDLPADVVDAPLELDESALEETMKEAGWRVNPKPNFLAIAEEIYGPLSDLD
jgi:predicted transcriptional regulator